MSLSISTILPRMARVRNMALKSMEHGMRAREGSALSWRRSHHPPIARLAYTPIDSGTTAIIACPVLTQHSADRSRQCPSPGQGTYAPVKQIWNTTEPACPKMQPFFLKARSGRGAARAIRCGPGTNHSLQKYPLGAMASQAMHGRCRFRLGTPII